MAHSRVFQFERFKKSDFDENDIEDIKEDFKHLVTYGLPNGMFDVNYEEMSLTYMNYPNDYIKRYIDTIKAEANKLSFEEGKINTWKLLKTIENFGNMYMVYSSEVDYARYVNDWIFEVAECEKIGTKFYLGGVLSYRY